MATSRKASSSMSLSVAQSLLARHQSVLDQERENFEKAQLSALTKALSLEEAASKEKHVRTLIIGTYDDRGAFTFWQKLQDNVPLHSSDVVCWKFLIILHRLIRDGHADVPKVSRPYCGFIDEVVKTHNLRKSPYGRLSFAYAGLVISRLLFHAKHPGVPGNLGKDAQVSKNDAANNFELAIDFLDLLERTIDFKCLVLNTFEAGKLNYSLTNTGQCRLSALVPCIHDSAKLFHLICMTLKVLHRSLPWDTLSGHRERFRAQYEELNKLYEKLDNFHYLRGLVQVPRLSGDISKFLNSLQAADDRQQQHQEEASYRPQHSQVPEPQQQHQDFFEVSEANNDLITVVDDPINASMAYLQQEYSDLSTKYQSVLQMLQEERRFREHASREIAEREQRLAQELQEYKQRLVESESKRLERVEAASTINGNDSNADKLEKLKAAYQKLRTEHITLLRQKAESDKNYRESMEQHSSKYQQVYMAINEFLAKNAAALDPGSWTNGGGRSSDHQLQQEQQLPGRVDKPGEVARFLTVLEGRLHDLKASLDEKAAAVSQLESEKKLMEYDHGEKALAAKQELLSLRDKELPDLRRQVAESRADSAKVKEVLAAAWRSKTLSQMVAAAQHISKRVDLDPLPLTLSGIPSSSSAVSPDETCRRLEALQDVLFLVLSTFLKLQPFASAATAAAAASPGEALRLDDLMVLGEALLLEAEAAEELCQEDTWRRFAEAANVKVAAAKAMQAWDPSNEVDREIKEMQDSISAAVAAMEKLMAEAKANERQKVNVDVDLKIIDSCSQLILAVEEMIRNARQLQREISEAGSGEAESSPSRKLSSVPGELYKKNRKWSEGLISAAKDIGGGARLLVDSANGVVNGEGKFEQLIAASQEIAGSTAQMVIASKVRARKESSNLKSLQTSSKSVAGATAQVIATCRACSSELEEADKAVDLSTLSVHQSKRMEMEIQIKVLELETQLQRQREKLFALRKLQYSQTGGGAGDPGLVVPPSPEESSS